MIKTGLKKEDAEALKAKLEAGKPTIAQITATFACCDSHFPTNLALCSRRQDHPEVSAKAAMTCTPAQACRVLLGSYCALATAPLPNGCCLHLSNRLPADADAMGMNII